MPNPEAEAFLGNLCIEIDEVGTTVHRPGDGPLAAPSGQLQVYFVLDGEAQCRSGDTLLTLKCGTLLVAPSALNLQFTVAQSELSQSNDQIVMFAAPPVGGTTMTLATIGLTVTSAAQLRICEQLDGALVEASGDAHIRQTVGLLLAEISHQQIGARSIIGALAKNLLLLAMREHLGKLRKDNPLNLLLAEPQIARVANAITDDPGKRYSMDSLARLAAMTPQALSRRFDALFGMAPNEFIQHARLTMAEAMLRTTDLPVKTIAGKVGFASRSHFSRLFSKFSGYDPTAYRNAHR